MKAMRTTKHTTMHQSGERKIPGILAGRETVACTLLPYVLCFLCLLWFPFQILA